MFQPADPAPLESLPTSPWTRRDLLRIGSLGLAATLLSPGIAPARTAASGRSRSVIFLWMAGGVTHIDSFDPKPDAPPEIRGPLRPSPTRVPGIDFCETLPCLARVADRLAVVRSYVTESDDHFLSQAYALSGRKVNASQIMTEPNVGAMVSSLHGPRNGLPGYIAVPGLIRPEPGKNLFVGGWLGAQHAPFAVGGQPTRTAFGTPQTAK